jgi:hypothetical protein
MSDSTDVINGQCSGRNGHLSRRAELVVLLAPAACSRKSTTDSISLVAPAGVGRWIAASQGPKVSNAYRWHDETIEWSGVCGSGFAGGNGVVRWLKCGREIGREDGEFRGGMMSGKGSRGIDNGDYYGAAACPRVDVWLPKRPRLLKPIITYRHRQPCLRAAC